MDSGQLIRAPENHQDTSFPKLETQDNKFASDSTIILPVGFSINDPRTLLCEDPPKVFFKSLKKTTTKTAVETAFSQYGKIRSIKFPYNNRRKRNLGYGWVHFFNPAVTEFLLLSVRKIQIDGRLVELQSFIPEKRHLDGTEAKAFDAIIKKHIREHSEERFCLKPDTQRMTQAADPKTPPNEAETAYVIRWNRHSVKPNHSLYFKLASLNPDKVETKSQNITYRILKPPVPKPQDKSAVLVPHSLQL